MFVMKSLVFTQQGSVWRPHRALPLSGPYFRLFLGQRPHRGEDTPTSNTSWMALRKQWKLYSIKPAKKRRR